MKPGVLYTTFHFPDSGANVITTDNSDWATNCPEYKVTAVQLEKEEMVVLGQVVKGVDVDDLEVGMTMELVLEPLHETDDDIKVSWKWQPVAS